MGRKSTKIDVKCNFCMKDIKKHDRNKSKIYYCDRECYKKNNTGEKNHNFGKKWDSVKKKEQSDIIKSKVNKKYRESCSKANKNKKFSQERIKKMHENRGFYSYSHKHTIESKKIIGIKSKEKFTNEHKKKFRLIMESKGFWTPQDQISEIKLYFKHSNWIERMWDRCSIDENKLINKFGIYSSINNSGGVVRDHIFSRSKGFNLKVFPELLRHPCNCQIILHRENVKKRFNCIDDCSQSIETLLEMIIKYDGIWNEHKLCLELIRLYKNGIRY
jgi:hypothetical protein